MNFNKAKSQNLQDRNLILEMRRKRNDREFLRFQDNGLAEQHDKVQQFIPILFSLLDHPDFRNRYMNKKRFRTYLWLRRKVIRGRLDNDMANVYYNYWDNGKLAVSLTQEKLSKDLNLSKSTISDHLRQLEKDGVLKIDIALSDETKDGLEHRVYVLGFCLMLEEKWFIDEVFK